MTDPDEDAAVAEYVLGTLDEAERADFDARRPNDRALDAAILAWEQRLAPLFEAVPNTAPPPHILPALIQRLFGQQGASAVTAMADYRGLKRSIRRWRSTAAACAAIAASLLAWIVLAPSARQDSRFVAVLQKDANSPAILLEVDVAARSLTMRPVAAQEPPDKSYELWLIGPSGGVPRSLGVVAPTGTTRASLTNFDPGTIKGATYAITLEPVGGSPTGAPSGSPILTGRLVSSP